MFKSYFRSSLIATALIFSSVSAFADENSVIIFNKETFPEVNGDFFDMPEMVQNSFNRSPRDDKDSEEWIKTKVARANKGYQVLSSDDILLNNEISFEWDISDYLSLSLNVFDNYLLNETSDYSAYSGLSSLKSYSLLDKSFSNNSVATTGSASNNYSGYRLGISSQLGLGNQYKLNLNFDYGQIDGAESVGFNNNEITTTSFGLGIRKNKFGASVNTDIYMEGNNEIGLFDNSRFGIELDWHFSDETKISLGSKKRLNSDTSTVQTNSLESLTGNVQYIKFQHNL